MKPRKITDNVYWLGAIDWDRRLFDSLIPMPDGTSYNSYLVKGNEKTAVIDTVDPMMANEFMAQLEDTPELDYLIVNHAEQDHAGTIPRVLEKYPHVLILSTQKGKEMLIDHLQIPASYVTAVQDGEKVDLGGKTIEFIHTPWVHWPDTMTTYLIEDRIMFSCDFFGSHLATTDLFVRDRGRVYEAAKRYYAEIMMPFRTMLEKNLDKVRDRDISMIAPSHGPIYPDPSFILDAYTDWVCGPPKNCVVLPFISMHGSTKKMVDYLVSALADRKVTVFQFDLTVTDIGKLAIALVDAATLVIGTPTVHFGPHPLVFYATYTANSLRPKLKFASIIGSYGWNSKSVEQITAMVPNLKVELLPPVMCKGFPQETDFDALNQLAELIAVKHKENELN